MAPIIIILNSYLLAIRTRHGPEDVLVLVVEQQVVQVRGVQQAGGRGHHAVGQLQTAVQVPPPTTVAPPSALWGEITGGMGEINRGIKIILIEENK